GFSLPQKPDDLLFCEPLLHVRPPSASLDRTPISSATVLGDHVGRASVDLNGKACSIELYYGRDILGNGDERPLVNWSSGGRPGTWQGAIQGKDGLKVKFMEKIRASTPEKLVGDWNDMKKLLAATLEPFEVEEFFISDW
ncbi:MAG: hypothetical protein AB7E73_13920, partial [Burkholderiales bacterium]